jgi:hypothetical protein
MIVFVISGAFMATLATDAGASRLLGGGEC